MDISLSHRCFSPTLSPSLSLSLLKKKKNKRKFSKFTVHMRWMLRGGMGSARKLQAECGVGVWIGGQCNWALNEETGSDR